MTQTIIEIPTQEPVTIIELTVIDPNACYIEGCDRESSTECHFCERPICMWHERRLPHFCQMHLSACSECYARQQVRKEE